MKSKTKAAVNFFRDLDDMAKLITGKPIPDIVSRGLNLLGITDKINNAMSGSSSGPYAVLGVREDANDIVIKAAYRSLQKRFHPDIGLEPNGEQSKKINEAYDEIQKLRGKKL